MKRIPFDWEKDAIKKKKRNYLYVSFNLKLLLKQTMDLKTLLVSSMFSHGFPRVNAEILINMVYSKDSLCIFHECLFLRQL